MDYIIQKLFYGSGTKRLKRYFHVVYGGARRTYGMQEEIVLYKSWLAKTRTRERKIKCEKSIVV